MCWRHVCPSVFFRPWHPRWCVTPAHITSMINVLLWQLLVSLIFNDLMANSFWTRRLTFTFASPHQAQSSSFQTTTECAAPCTGWGFNRTCCVGLNVRYFLLIPNSNVSLCKCIVHTEVCFLSEKSVDLKNLNIGRTSDHPPGTVHHLVL